MLGNGKIAPGGIIKLPIEINAEELENINVKYDITIDQIVEDMYPKIIIQDVIIEDTNTKLTQTEGNTFTGIINTRELKTHNVSVSVMWENKEENNELDTQLGTSNETKKVLIPIKVIVSQYTEET